MKSFKAHVTESTEEISELSKKTLGSYAKKASQKAQDLARDIDKNMDKAQDAKGRKHLSALDRKYSKRKDGYHKAIDRLTK